MAKVAVKVQHKDDIRRVSFEEKPSFNALYQLIKNLFADAQIQHFSIKYTDDEGDLISITNDREIAEAWEFAKSSNNLLKLKITVADPKAKIPTPKPQQPISTPIPSNTRQGGTWRKLSLEDARKCLLELGVNEDAINRMNRWERIDLIRSKSSSPSMQQQQQQPSTPTIVRPVTDVPVELISNFIEKVLGEVKKLQDSTPEVKDFLSLFSLEDLIKQFQPVLQQFTSEGLPAQLYHNRSAITSSIEQDIYNHMLPLLSAFGPLDSNPTSTSTSSKSSSTPSSTSSSTSSSSSSSTSSVNPNPEPNEITGAPTAAVNVFCNLCNNSLQSTRHKCSDCPDYNLCDSCLSNKSNLFHNPLHSFTKMVYNTSSNFNSNILSETSNCPNSPRYSNLPKLEEQEEKKKKERKENEYKSSRLIKDVTIEDGTQVEVKSKFVKTWRMKNNGNVEWELGTRLVFVQGDLPCGDVERVEIGREVGVDEEVDVSIDMVAPGRPGRYISNFRLEDNQGNRFGHRIWVDIVVVEPEIKEEVKKDENEEKLDVLESITGFCDREKNRRLLAKNRGDVVYTVHELMGYL